MTNKTIIALAFVAAAILTTSTAYAEIQNNGFGGQKGIDASNAFEEVFTLLKAKIHAIITQVNANTSAITALQSGGTGSGDTSELETRISFLEFEPTTNISRVVPTPSGSSKSIPANTNVNTTIDLSCSVCETTHNAVVTLTRDVTGFGNLEVLETFNIVLTPNELYTLDFVTNPTWYNVYAEAGWKVTVVVDGLFHYGVSHAIIDLGIPFPALDASFTFDTTEDFTVNPSNLGLVARCAEDQTATGATVLLNGSPITGAILFEEGGTQEEWETFFELDILVNAGDTFTSTAICVI